MAWFLITFGFVIMATGTLIELLVTQSVDNKAELLEISFWLNGLSAILLLSGVLLIGRIFKYIRRTEKVRQSMDKKLLTTIIQTEEKERFRFSKELHDGLGPLLSTIKLSISSLIKIEKDAKSLEILENTGQIVQDALKTIKDVSNNLSPHILTNFGLEKAVNNFSNRVNESSLLQVGVVSNLGDQRFDSNTEIILYRVICELINNTLKHASATHVMIDLRTQKQELHVVYTDDGIGFDTETVLATTSGMGLSNMRSRINSLNGNIDIQSEKDEGVIFNIDIPIKK
ncbi:MAG: ATP-binding protein [Bacteroidales bacterium]|nr:ATP-binding protein [Bacteroidales bacterium]